MRRIDVHSVKLHLRRDQENTLDRRRVWQEMRAINENNSAIFSTVYYSTFMRGVAVDAKGRGKIEGDAGRGNECLLTRTINLKA